MHLLSDVTVAVLCSTAEHAVNAIRTIHRPLAVEWQVGAVVPEAVVPREVTVTMGHQLEAVLVVVCRVVVALRPSSSERHNPVDRQEVVLEAAHPEGEEEPVVLVGPAPEDLVVPNGKALAVGVIDSTLVPVAGYRADERMSGRKRLEVRLLLGKRTNRHERFTVCLFRITIFS